jgi:heterodisulfide reductase subunit A
MYATKEAIIAKEHDPKLDVFVFFMDMRAFSKGYWRYFKRARDQYGIEYERCRVSSLREDPLTRDLILDYQGEDGNLYQLRFDIVVLSVGMEISASVQQLGRDLGVELDEYGFCSTVQFNPVETSRPGIYAVGPFREPKDIPDSVIEASGAAAAAAARISSARFSQTTHLEYPVERDVSGEEPRIGLFVCHCGSNIAGFLDVAAVSTYAASLPFVIHTESSLYTCSQDSVKHITEIAREQKLNRIVIASCSPLTHGSLFQDSLRMAGLNPYLFEMANIRNHCSWVHSDNWEVATEKAKDLVRMAVARAALLEPQHTVDVPVQQGALVVGGGVAGMTAALSLADQRFPVHLVEKEAELGGNLRHVFTASSGKDPQRTLRQLVERVLENESISLHLNSQVIQTSGFKGNFNSTIRGLDEADHSISHGVTILATGAQEYRGIDYGYGTDPRIITQQELEKKLHEIEPISLSNALSEVVMIQCVGPAEQFCSRICCSVALKNALAIKKINPDSSIVILYKDIRTYGFAERLYTQAREQGVIFVRYDDDHKPEVEISNPDSPIRVRVWDPILRRLLLIHPKLLVLSMPVVPRSDMHELARLFKVPVDTDGFFLEAHVKLRPVDFSTDGIFMAGMAHYPKLLDETMIQAQAAASRAACVLSKETLTAGGQVAVVDESLCTGCLTCVRICPFSVPQIRPSHSGVGNILGAAYVEASVCQGCGTCVAECPARAIQLMHYTDAQMVAKVDALVHSPRGFVPLADIVEVSQ